MYIPDFGVEIPVIKFVPRLVGCAGTLAFFFHPLHYKDREPLKPLEVARPFLVFLSLLHPLTAPLVLFRAKNSIFAHFFWPHHVACRILVLRPGIEHVSPTMEVGIPNL